MSYIKTTLIALALVLVPLASVSAATFQSGENVSVGGQVNILDDIYAAGNSIVTQAEIEGDFIAGGRNISITKTVQQDVIAAGQTISINAPVGDDIRAAGQTVSINDVVGDDIIAAGADVLITGDVGGDIVVGGALVTINSEVVEGNIKVDGEKLFINGAIGGDVQADVQELVLGENASIAGTLTLPATTKFTGNGEVVGGGVIKTAVADKDHDKGGIKKFFFFGLLFKMLSLLVLAGVLGYGLKKIAIQTYKAAFTKKGFWKQVGKGFLFIVVGPIAVIILFVLGVTWPLAFILLFSWIATLIAAVGMTAVVVGSWLYGWILRRKDKKAEYDGAPNWKSLLLGVAAMFIIGLIPVLGTLFIFILICSVLGAFYDIKMKAYKKL